MKGRLISLTLCLILALSAVPVFADTNPDTTSPTSAFTTKKLTDKEITQISDIMTKDGVDQELQNSVINKIQKGEMLDCDNPEKIAALPKDALTIKKGEMKKIYVFPDGSYRKSYMIPIIPKNRDILLEAIRDQKKVDSLLAKKSSRFNIQSYTYHDIWVQDGTPVIQAGFSVNFRLSTGNDSIIYNAYGPNVWCAVGSSSDSSWQLSIPYQYENQTGLCEAKLRFVYVYIGQSTLYTHFYITGGDYWTEYGGS